MARRRLGSAFYRRDNVVAISRELLGKALCSRIDGKLCRLRITETEAYAGERDRASHAFGGRRTARTEPMFGPGGHAYVYLCYGIHHLFNVVTGRAGVPHAVLIRAATIVDGEKTVLERRGRRCRDRDILVGPGKVSQALGITTALTGSSLAGDTVWIEDASDSAAGEEVLAGPRVGVDYAGDDAALPYRFRLVQPSWRTVPPNRAVSR